jgi:hypothetical protein
MRLDWTFLICLVIFYVHAFHFFFFSLILFFLCYFLFIYFCVCCFRRSFVVILD